MLKICAFGEILLRLNPFEKSKFISLPDSVEFSYGGSEFNFLVNLANLGVKSYFISALPDNSLGYSVLSLFDKFKINRQYVRLIKRGRLGIYFLEEGISNRASSVIYDRKGSCINLLEFEDFPFNKIFSKTNHYHISGITPALSKSAMYSAIRSVRLAKELGLEVSLDLNYRSKLWDYKVDNETVKIERIMSDIAAYCDFLFGNESDVQNMFGIDHDRKKINTNEDLLIYYQNILLKVSKRFPHIKVIALSIRKSVNASSNYFGGVLYIRQTNQFFFSPNIMNNFEPHHIIPINDRIGAGDSFSSGLLYGLNKYNNIQYALDFAVASAVLKHSYRKDQNYATLSDVKNFLSGDKSGRIKR